MNQTAIDNYIARKREAQNLTQEQLAQQRGVSNKTISKEPLNKCSVTFGGSLLQQKKIAISLHKYTSIVSNNQETSTTKWKRVMGPDHMVQENSIGRLSGRKCVEMIRSAGVS